MRHPLLCALVLLALPWPVTAQVSSPTKVDVKDEGTSQGRVGSLNCVGTGIVCTVSGDTGTLTISGGGSVSVTSATLTFGATAGAKDQAVTYWRPQGLTVPAADVGLRGIAWAPSLGLFAAVGNTTPGAVFTSPDGKIWTARTVPEPTNTWRAITWAPSLTLFVAVASTGANRVMTSPDGVNWTARAAASASVWRAVAWAPSLSLFVAVSSGFEGVATEVMSSPDGIAWTSRTAASNDSWQGVTWSPSLSLFVAVNLAGANPVMTSPNGTAWTTRTGPVQQWQAVTWSPELSVFVAVATDVAVNNAVMSSSDGITWTQRINPVVGNWFAVAWSPTLGQFVAVNAKDDGVNTFDTFITSTNGTEWTARRTPPRSIWSGLTWSPELGVFAAVAFNPSAGAASNNLVTLSSVLAGSQLERFTITDAAVTTTSKIVGVIRRPNVTNADDPGWTFTVNVVRVQTGSFDIEVAMPDSDHLDLPTGTIEFLYVIG